MTGVAATTPGSDRTRVDDRVEHLAVTGAIGRRARERQLREQEPVLGEAGVERAQPRQAADEDAGGRHDGDGQRREV